MYNYFFNLAKFSYSLIIFSNYDLWRGYRRMFQSSRGGGQMTPLALACGSPWLDSFAERCEKRQVLGYQHESSTQLYTVFTCIYTFSPQLLSQDSPPTIPHTFYLSVQVRRAANQASLIRVRRLADLLSIIFLRQGDPAPPWLKLRLTYKRLNNDTVTHTM